MSRTFVCLLIVLAVFAGGAELMIAQDSPAPPIRQLRITFLPPPLEGTISLGIYDTKGKLVRVLHREAELDDFTIGADALSTTWDGKNDGGEPCPPGKYSARGFAVGKIDIEDPVAASNDSGAVGARVVVKLIANPLTPGKKPMIELAGGIDEDGTFLETADGLPLFTVDETTGVAAVSLTKRSDRSVDFLENDGDSTDQFRLNNVDQMMAFDCGEIQLK